MFRPEQTKQERFALLGFPFLVFSETQVMYVPSKAAEESSPILIPVYKSNKIAPQALPIYSFFSCRAEQNSMIFLSSCTVNAFPFFAEHPSESLRNQKGERVFQRRRIKFIDLIFPKLPNRKKNRRKSYDQLLNKWCTKQESNEPGENLEFVLFILYERLFSDLKSNVK